MDKKYKHILLEEGDILELANRREKLIECEHERDAWKAEAMAARILVDAIKDNIDDYGEKPFDCVEKEYSAYIAARVKNTP